MDLIDQIVLNAPNFIGFVVAILFLANDAKAKQATIDRLIDVIVKRENCDDDDHDRASESPRPR